MKIGNLTFEKPIILAPMESITDLPFRIICKRMGADLVYSEFIASEALTRNVEKSFKKLSIAEEERPVAIQIFGANIDSMLKSAKIVEQTGADILDINFGCWVRKVVNNNAGAAFLKNPKKIYELTKVIVENINIPVTIKTRLGWDSNSINIIETAKYAEDAGVSAIAIHCRTRDMAMRGQADWSWIPKVKEAVNIPIILNGDVKTCYDAKRAFETTNCDGVMIGRSAIGNPFIFREVKDYIFKGIEPTQTNIEERISLCLQHLELNIKYKGLHKGILEFRKHYSGYLKGLRNNNAVKLKLLNSTSYDEIRQLLDDYLQELLKSS